MQIHEANIEMFKVMLDPLKIDGQQKILQIEKPVELCSRA